MVYEKISRIVPKNLIDWFGEQLDFVGIEVGEKRFAGFLIAFGIALSFAISFNLLVFLKIPMIYSFGIALALFFLTIFVWLNNVSQSRGKFVEKILPDAMQLIASNIKAGLTTEKALMVSARPEFGQFSSELKKASEKIFFGERLDIALLELSKKIKSRVLERTMLLLVQGMKSGGEIVTLLFRLSDDLREEIVMKEEINANISMYLLLIVISAAFGAPLLFGISSFIVGMVSKQMGAVHISEAQISQYGAHSPIGGFVGIPSSAISESFVTFFAEIALFVTCIFAGLTLGAINSGREIDGIKYIPIMLLISFALFFTIRLVISQVFGSLFHL